MILRALDRIAYWLRDGFGPQAQLRMGICLVLLSLPFYAYLPFSGEPPVIYFLSVAALTMTGITIVVAAENLDDESDS